MSRKFIILTATLLLSLVALAACAGMGIPETGDGLSQEDRQATFDVMVRQAAEATATQMAVSTLIAQLQTQAAGEPLVVTATPEPVLPGQATATTAPAATATATATLLPTSTSTPVPPTNTPTATPIPCNLALFVADVTVPDGSVLLPNSTFTKIWRLKNIGSCTWTSGYDIVFTGGSQMNGPAAVDFPASVAPGQTVDLPVNLTAPGSEGSYRSEWKIRSETGALFGVGASSAPFYADIRVTAPQSRFPLDFAAALCSAEWTTGAGRLTCPVPEGDSRGYVFAVDKLTLENGYVDDEPGLVMHPQSVNDGVIRGKYPSFRVEQGHYFRAVIGCAYNAKGCDVKFQLDYQIGSGSIQTLKTWSEVYDEQYQVVEADLSSLKGQDVKFILTVLANGSADADRVFWLAPRIEK